MKAIASVAIAGTLAVASLTTTATTADAGGKQWKQQYHQHKHYPQKHYTYKHYPQKKHYHSKGWNPGAAFATGTVLGLAFGALAAPTYYYAPPPVVYYPPPPPAYPTYYAGGPYAQHVSWCQSRYRSYNAGTNTWVGFDGIVRHCVSPFPY